MGGETLTTHFSKSKCNFNNWEQNKRRNTNSYRHQTCHFIKKTISEREGNNGKFFRPNESE
jgi:hypothetical protein